LGIAFASIGLGHGVFMLPSARFWANSEPWLKNTMERREQSKKTLSGKCISDVEKLKRGQGRRGVAESP